MKRSLLGYLTAFQILTGFQTFPVFAVSPVASQKVVTFHIDLDPPNLPPFLAEKVQEILKTDKIPEIPKVRGEAPLFILTDSQGRIAGLQLGDKDTRFVMETAEGIRPGISLDPTPVSFELLSQHRYLVELKFLENSAKRMMILVDGTQLDRERGGPVWVEYLGSLLRGTHQKMLIQLEKIGEKWVASTRIRSHFVESKLYGSDVTIRMARMDLGLARPEFTAWDPNALVATLKTDPVQNPRITDDGEKLLEGFQKQPAKAYGFELSLTLLPADSAQ